MKRGDEFGEMKVLLSLTLLSMAVVTDLRSFRISNCLIVIGFILGLIFQIFTYGVRGAGVFFLNVSIPMILFYLLFLIRVLGAGDVKLFSMIGGIWGVQILCKTIVISFLAGAAMSLCKLLYQRNLISRLLVFREYAYQVLHTGKLSEYPQEVQGKDHVIHFSIAILIGYPIAMEVGY